MKVGHAAVEPYFKGSLSGAVLRLRVQPRSARRGFLGFYGECKEQLRWGVGAAPTDGKANEELIDSIASTFEVSKRSVILLSGKTRRLKMVLVLNLKSDQILTRLEVF